MANQFGSRMVWETKLNIILIFLGHSLCCFDLIMAFQKLSSKDHQQEKSNERKFDWFYWF